MAEQMMGAVRKSWSGRIGKLALWVVVLGIAVALIGAVLARYDLVEKLQGFSAFGIGGMIIAGGGALALIALIIGLIGKSGPKKPALMALGAAALVLGSIYAIIAPGMGAPPLHDITTDVDNPPQFKTLALREDNLVPFKSVEEWRAAHRAAYGDIAPVTLPGTPEQVLDKAKVLVEARGWEVATFDPASGHLEATASTAFIRFYDDFIVDATPIEGGGTLVNVRSVSRVGVGDLGANARRVREFLAALQAA